MTTINARKILLNPEALNGLDASFECEGERSLFCRPRRALLISRTKRNPFPATPWVRSVIEAVRKIQIRNEVLVTGLGRTAFDVALAACRACGGSAIIVLNADRSLQEWMAYAEGLLPENVMMVWPKALVGVDDGAIKVSLKIPQRDLMLAQFADRAWTMDVRKNGHMAAVAKLMQQSGAMVSSFQGSASDENSNVATKTDMQNKLVLDSEVQIPDSFLVHFTRAPDGLWPDEGPAEYAHWLANGAVNERRESFDTLRRILRMQCIQGSGQLMPGSIPGVSFTASTPKTWASLMRWRKGLRRWTFRPYGVAVERTALEALGAESVRYLPASKRKALPNQEQFFTQKHEPPEVDWSAEAEWRLKGSLDLSSLPVEKLMVLTATAEEAQEVEREFKLKALPVCKR